jgi:hypothetical protein
MFLTFHYNEPQRLLMRGLYTLIWTADIGEVVESHECTLSVVRSVQQCQ